MRLPDLSFPAADRPRPPGTLRSGPRFWLWAVMVVAGLDAVSFLSSPQLVSSGAYAWAMEIMGPTAWGVLMAVTFVLALYALAADGKSKSGLQAMRLSLVLHGTICGTFGLSILVLTLNGTVSAISGATKWWIFFAVAARFLRYRILTEPPAESVGQ